MSMRRFVVYFLAVSAGSTVAFASTSRGQPAPQASAMKEAGMIPTATDVGLDVLPPGTVRLFQAQREHSRHKPPVKTARVALAKKGAG